ncbi:ATP-binding cassette domain-containing protein [Jannaschia sp. R86511]|uniref:ATP-binding cassette domain-containing protein n=1 Tax=Jannaschia sp. R86511 TaxID=3093853 RepID=UPI0036D224DD
MLAEEAQLVIFDEVSSLLNDLEIAQFHEAVRHLLSQGCSVVHIAHRLEEITALSDRVVVLRDGQVVHDVPARTVSTDDLARAMLARELRVASRERRQHGEQVYAVRGLTVPDQVAGIDLTLHAGEVLGLIGMRSSGVLALVEAVAGLVESNASSVEVGGVVIDSPGRHEGRVAYVSGPDEQMLQGNMAELLTPGQEDSPEIQRLRNAAAAVTHLGVSTSYIQGTVSTLSGGDRQKVVLASVAETTADVVVFAYPTRGIDIGAKEQAYEIIDGLAERGKGVVLLGTDVTELLRHCDRVAVVHEGVLAAVVDADGADEDVVMGYALTGTRRSREIPPEPVEDAQGPGDVPAHDDAPVFETRKARRFAWF